MFKFIKDKNIMPEWQANPYRIGKVASGRTVLVTGATSAAGRKLCRQLIDKGDRLIVLVRNKRKAIEIYGPHAMVITNVDVIGRGTAIDQVINLNGAKKASSILKNWLAPFL